MLEIGVTRISNLFYKLKDKLEHEVTVKTHAVWKIPKIDENSTIGQQIKYYRRLANIKQSDLCLKLGCDRGVLDRLENRELKLVNINLIKDVIKELDIEDKIFINDDYIAFLLDNPSKAILDFRKKNNLKQIDLARILGKSLSVIKNWENGKSQMTRASYNELKSIFR
ncbi:MAG: helix-turn-helix transcriptional regulator [Clostridia bacterium]|nr:helix-turn-helix transcriptional regulator [Clostridia bacterium]